MESLEDTFKTLSIARRLTPEEPNYILDVALPASTCPGSELVAVCCSNHLVRLHCRETLRLQREFRGHTATLCGVRFAQSSPELLFSGATDGTLRCWDVRQSVSEAVRVFQSDPTHLYTAFDVSFTDLMLCAGTEQVDGEDSFLVFWDARMVGEGKGEDLRQTGLLGVYSESHSDDITAVRFHSQHRDRLASGSMDGLVNVFDLSLTSEDEALLTTCNCDSSVSSITWAGKDLEQLLCLSHDEGVHLWNVGQPDSDEPLTLFTAADARTLATVPSGTALDYFVGGAWQQDSECLLLVGGSKNGELHLLDCRESGLKLLRSLGGGHSATVRCFQWDPIGCALFTGGEDGQLLQWRKGAEEINFGKKDTLKSISAMQLKAKAHRKTSSGRPGKPM